MEHSDITICDGPAGSGKTAVAVGLACQYLQEGRINKIVITRPIVESGKGLGYLPGNFQEKVHPYLVPILEEMNLYLSREKVHTLQDDGTIEICPLEYMRGRNFHNSFIILDEAQNATIEQIKMFITRLGRKSKAVVNGDVNQTDLPNRVRGGLSTCISCLRGLHGVGIVELDDDDVIRHGIISAILYRLEDAQGSA